MSNSNINPKSFKDMNKEFQYLWNKFGRDDWEVKNLGDYCVNLEYMIMNYLDRNNELNPIKSTASKKQNSEVIYKNYDYADQDMSAKKKTKSGPGGGLYDGKMDKYKSVKEFVDTDRKLNQKKRKDALKDILKGRSMANSLSVQVDNFNDKTPNSLSILANSIDSLLTNFATGIIGDVEIPKDVLEKIEEEKDKKDKNDDVEKEISEESIDSGINGIPYFNSRDPASGLDGLNQASPGTPWDNDYMRNSYSGILSLQGSLITEILKMADIYYNLSTKR